MTITDAKKLVGTTWERDGKRRKFYGFYVVSGVVRVEYTDNKGDRRKSWGYDVNYWLRKAARIDPEPTK